ncbi:MAG: hypothetical protein M3131_01175 [Actinomycetota bacterium]|nr:hypothetical protein [Actinomycetota bacterium]
MAAAAFAGAGGAAAPAQADVGDCLTTAIVGTIVEVHADDPWIGDNGDVFGSGSLSMARNLCGAQTQTVNQTKACGFWGCSWEERQASGWVNAREGKTRTASSFTCREGTNRYRTKQVARFPQIGDSGPAYETAYSANEPEFTC